MKRQLLFLLTLIMSGIGYAQAGYTCAEAIAITADDTNTITSPGIIGSEVPSPVCAANGSGATGGYWYTFQPTTTATYTLTTDLTVNTGIDTRVHVYTGSCGALTCEAGDDDSGAGYLSHLEFYGVAGTTYYIAFDDRWDTDGFEFMLIEGFQIPPPEPGEFVFIQDPSISMSGTSYAMVDMDNDGLDDLVSGSSTHVNINHQTDTGFSYQSFQAPASFGPSWSMAAGDLDANGYNDLIYGASSGVSIVMANGTGTGYSQSYTTSTYVFSQRSNFVDINNDGFLDAFVCHDVDQNVYFINDGTGAVTFYQGASTALPNGLGTHSSGGNYGTVWIDFDNDRDVDLFIAKCRGGSVTHKVNELWRNDGNGVFVNIADLGYYQSNFPDQGHNNSSNLGDPIQTWSSAWADFDNDGDMDVYVGASSSADGPHKYMINNGDGTFTNATATANISNAPYGIENAPGDFNNDGYVDILTSGKILLNNGDNSFTLHETDMPPSGAIGDANNDGFLDVFRGSLYLNNGGNGNNYVKIKTVGTASNINGIGARIEVHTSSGTQIRDVRSGEGFEFMSSLTAHFGLGTETTINNVTIYWPSGVIDVFPNLDINTQHTLIEGASLAIEDAHLSDLVIYPNPVKDNIYFETSGNVIGKIATVFDINGKIIQNERLEKTQLDVSTLAAGVYILRLELEGKTTTRKFIKK
ncbi:FG-GAP-like repeat-containing protein [Mangrovimonas yunxiaonensis]|uniref:FG-GAP-like repeat-containing protein n=1 Tax=Mangrovimonas yunxiaonensis TaxID=1197477 RepID=UPI0009FD717D|nr:FG-GAP-like repeat-containing protein [Mangrovimonas yunxiaonensis]